MITCRFPPDMPMSPHSRRISLALAVIVAFSLGFASDAWMARIAPAASRATLVGLVIRFDMAVERGDTPAVHAMLLELDSMLEIGAGDELTPTGLEAHLLEPTGLATRPRAIVALVLANRLVGRGETERAIQLCLPIWSDDRAAMEQRMEAGLRMAQALRVEGRYAVAEEMQAKALGLPVPARTRLRLNRELGI